MERAVLVKAPSFFRTMMLLMVRMSMCSFMAKILRDWRDFVQSATVVVDFFAKGKMGEKEI